MEDKILTDEQFSKLLFQYRSNLMAILEPLNRYGQQDYVQMIYEPLTSLAVQLHYKLCGEMMDQPFDPNLPRVYPP